MSAAADTFGSFGRYGHQTAGARAARIFDHVATWAMAIVLLLIGGLAGYSSGIPIRSWKEPISRSIVREAMASLSFLQ